MSSEDNVVIKMGLLFSGCQLENGPGDRVGDGPTIKSKVQKLFNNSRLGRSKYLQVIFAFEPRPGRATVIYS